MKLLKLLKPFLREQLGAATIALIAMVVYAITTALYAFISGPALKYLFSGEVDDILKQTDGKFRSVFRILPPEWLSRLESFSIQDGALFLPLIIVAIATIKGLAQAGQFYYMGEISQKLLKRLRSHSFANVVDQPMVFFTSRSQGDLISRLTNDVNQIEQAIFYGLGPMIREPLVLLGLLTYLFGSHTQLALLTFITIPIAAVPLVRFTTWLKSVSKRGQGAQAEMNRNMYEALAGIQVVKAFGTEKQEANKLNISSIQYLKEMLASYFIRAVRTPVMEVLGAVALAAIIGWVVQGSASSQSDPADYMSFFAALLFMYDPIKKLGKVADFIATGDAAAERIDEVTQRMPQVEEPPNATAYTEETQIIGFKDISFRYNDNWILKNIDLQCTRGETIAFVGASGSGKTTLLNLLARFYDPQQGTISLNDKDTRSMTLASLRQQFSIVGQDTFLFNTTVAENIAYGTENSNPKDIEAAAKMANAHEFVTKLPSGYGTVIGERGMTLSGGQRQRIAIARAFLRNAPILLLDEATSALDVESEQQIQTALDSLIKGRTCFVVAHRLTTIQNADKILVIKEGKIIEEGNHRSLLNANTEYARLYSMQFESNEPTLAMGSTQC